jgi:FtsH-binding integral membrane protein
MNAGVVCRIAKTVCLIGSALMVVLYALESYEKGNVRLGLALWTVAFGLNLYGWLTRHQPPSVLSMLLGDLIALPLMALSAATFFALAIFLHSGAIAFFDAALGVVAATAAIVVGRRILNRMLAGIENPAFRAAEQTMLEGIGELVEGLQAEKAILKAA